MTRFRPRLILFDIDGTLLKGGPRLRQWFGQSLRQVYGRAGNIDGHSFSGKTDPQLVTELMVGAGLPEDRVSSLLPELKEVYLSRIREELTPEDMTLLPEVVPVLDRLQDTAEVTLGLLTGNWEEGARTKLACFELNRFFPFGAFAEDGADRNDLPPVALERASRLDGRIYSPDETLIVGDSTGDVSCAQAHGIRVAAVATGFTSKKHLQETGADWVLNGLEESVRIHPVFG